MAARDLSGKAEQGFWMEEGSADAPLDPASFAEAVLRQADRALGFLGRTSRKPVSATDLEAAKKLIDELARLEGRTQGRLPHDDEELIHHTLTTLRMTYVEAAEQQVRTRRTA
jgi:hypothetical protein